jgi:hypothetical protein
MKVIGIPVLVKEKKIEATGTNSSKVATVPNLGKLVRSPRFEMLRHMYETTAGRLDPNFSLAGIRGNCRRILRVASDWCSTDIEAFRGIY